MKTRLLTWLVLPLIGVLLLSCNKDEEVIDPLAVYYGDYLGSDPKDPDNSTWNVKISASENKGEIMVTNALGQLSENDDLIALIAGSTFTIPKQDLTDEISVEGIGSLTDGVIPIRITFTRGTILIFTSIEYKKR